MALELCVRPDRQHDPHYRYKMPHLECVRDNRNKQRKTHLPNAADVSRNIFRPESWLVKYLALQLSVDSGGGGATEAYLSGHHDSVALQQLVFGFIKEYVLCKCGSPETLLYVEGKKRRRACKLRCHSCGRDGKAAGQDEKLLNLFSAKPMPPELCPMLRGGLGAALRALDDDDDKEELRGLDAAAVEVSADVHAATPPERAHKRVSWDEDSLAEHRRCAGVLYGTQRIEETVTPFLYYSESVSRGEGMVGEFVPGCGPTKVSISALQERLGLLSIAQDAGAQLRASPGSMPPLPPAPWVLLTSRSEPGEHFYFNPATEEASWSLPSDERGAGSLVDAGAPGAGAATSIAGQPLAADGLGEAITGEASGEEEEEVPLPQSRLANAVDCAAAYAHRRMRSGAATPSIS